MYINFVVEAIKTGARLRRDNVTSGYCSSDGSP